MEFNATHVAYFTLFSFFFFLQNIGTLVLLTVCVAIVRNSGVNYLGLKSANRKYLIRMEPLVNTVLFLAIYRGGTDILCQEQGTSWFGKRVGHEYPVSGCWM